MHLNPISINALDVLLIRTRGILGFGDFFGISPQSVKDNDCTLNTIHSFPSPTQKFILLLKDIY